MSDTPKRPSGGRRATLKRQALREAAARRVAGVPDPPAPVTRSPQTHRDIADPPSDPRRAADWILTVLMRLAAEALGDVGLEPPQQRREAKDHLAAATKAIDSAKLTVELDELEALLNRRPDGTSEHSFEDSGGPTPTRQ